MGRRASLGLDRSNLAEHERARAEGLEWSKKVVKQAFKGSKIKDRTGKLPHFDFDELKLGAVLGQGQFGDISEVISFRVKGVQGQHKYRANRPNKINYQAQDSFDARTEQRQITAGEDARAFLAKHCIRQGGNPRYAVKVLSSKVITDTEKFLQGIQDMAIEGRILSDLDHPNIIKMRATAKVDAYNEYFFFVLDKLYQYLEDRMAEWHNRASKKANPISNMFGKKSKPDSFNKELYKEKISVMYDLSDAIRYCHSRHIMHRDIRPENVGFDVVSCYKKNNPD